MNDADQELIQRDANQIVARFQKAAGEGVRMEAALLAGVSILAGIVAVSEIETGNKVLPTVIEMLIDMTGRAKEHKKSMMAP